jgi:anhydro-N-acetylmuramic acid kinase
MKQDKILGIMSGTSLDGVDYALCAVDSKSIKLLGLWSVPYSKEIKTRLMKAATNQLLSYDLAQLHHDLGRFYAKHAPQTKFDYIGMHGQTIFHNPTKPDSATFQLGEPSYLAERFNVPVVNQFRNMDLALSGQGAPLATLFHRFVFHDPNQITCVHNLGGISNVTYLPKNAKKILSFDTGPANILIDRAMMFFTKGRKHFDREGLLAGQGIAKQALIQKWMDHRFFHTKPPKSTGREDFGEVFFEKIMKDCKKLKLSQFDTLATLTDFSAKSIAHAYEKFLPEWPSIVILCGGGALNPTFVSLIRQALNARAWETRKNNDVKRIAVTTTDALGWPSQGIEASAFALLAYHTKHRLPGNVPATTGARHEAVLGQTTSAPL